MHSHRHHDRNKSDAMLLEQSSKVYSKVRSNLKTGNVKNVVVFCCALFSLPFCVVCQSPLKRSNSATRGRHKNARRSAFSLTQFTSHCLFSHPYSLRIILKWRNSNFQDEWSDAIYVDDDDDVSWARKNVFCGIFTVESRPRHIHFSHQLDAALLKREEMEKEKKMLFFCFVSRDSKETKNYVYNLWNLSRRIKDACTRPALPVQIDAGELESIQSRRVNAKARKSFRSSTARRSLFCFFWLLSCRWNPICAPASLKFQIFFFSSPSHNSSKRWKERRKKKYDYRMLGSISPRTTSSGAWKTLSRHTRVRRGQQQQQRKKYKAKQGSGLKGK